MTATLHPAAPMFRRDHSSTSDQRTPREARLWIDGVGCWMLWLTDRLTIGGPQQSDSSRSPADLQLFADLPRKAVALERVQENYRLTSDCPAAVNGRPCGPQTFLRHRDEITLGRDVRLGFELPTPLSASAKVAFLSGHRPAERIEGIVLLQETCLIGSGAEHHIPCRDLSSPVVIFRKHGQLWCRCREEWRLDGRAARDAQELRDGCLVNTENLLFRVELR